MRQAHEGARTDCMMTRWNWNHDGVLFKVVRDGSRAQQRELRLVLDHCTQCDGIINQLALPHPCDCLCSMQCQVGNYHSPAYYLSLLNLHAQGPSVPPGTAKSAGFDHADAGGRAPPLAPKPMAAHLRNA